jgi:hypothetical protein
MARSYAQIAAVVFLIAGIGGFFTGDAGTVTGGRAGGNFDSVTLHLTYARDALDLVLGAAFAYAATAAPARVSRLVVLAAGAVLMLLAVVGFIVSDDGAGSRSFAGLHFTLALNVLDLVAGTLAVLAGLGDVAQAPVSQPAR